jgi:Flp pilus assembly pilin Flp
MKIKSKVRNFFKDQSGEFGIKQIAITVAVIVIIGFLIAIIQGNLPTWVDEIWQLFMDLIGKFIS